MSLDPLKTLENGRFELDSRVTIIKRVLVERAEGTFVRVTSIVWENGPCP